MLTQALDYGMFVGSIDVDLRDKLNFIFVGCKTFSCMSKCVGNNCCDLISTALEGAICKNFASCQIHTQSK